jgi:hypothetical protein
VSHQARSSYQRQPLGENRTTVLGGYGAPTIHFDPLAAA